VRKLRERTGLARQLRLVPARAASWPLLALIAAALQLAASLAPAQGAVRLLNPGDEMIPLAPVPQWMQPSADSDKAPKLDSIRIAVADGDSGLLSGMTPQAAPFEIVAPTAAPDLIYDPGTRQAISKGEVIAYDQTPADLPAVIDRMAFADGIAGLAAAHPQPISIAAGAPVRRRDERVEIDLTGMAHRALVLFSVSGDGLVQALYPIGADQKIIDAADFAFPFEVHEPFGTDLVVAVSAAQPMDALEAGLRRLSHYRGAGEVLKLIAATAPPDARFGVAALQSAP
jgi:hypothetical protein